MQRARHERWVLSATPTQLWLAWLVSSLFFPFALFCHSSLVYLHRLSTATAASPPTVGPCIEKIFQVNCWKWELYTPSLPSIVAWQCRTLGCGLFTLVINKKIKMEFLLNLKHFCIINKLKNCKWSHCKPKTVHNVYI